MSEATRLSTHEKVKTIHTKAGVWLACQYCGGRLPVDGGIIKEFLTYCQEECAANDKADHR